MSFGLTIIPKVFTKMTKVLAKILADKEVSVLMCSDDWFVIAPSSI